MEIRINEKGQATAPPSIPISAAAFAVGDSTSVTWLGGAGIFIHSRSSNIMIDPVLEGFDMPLLYEIPIRAEDVPSLDAVLITHIDNDHFSRPTCRKLQAVCPSFHAPGYVAQVLAEEGCPSQGHEIGDVFQAGVISAGLTRAKHDWQNGSAKWRYRVWEEKDSCGYYLHTPDGTIWLPGDSRLLEEQLHMPEPDVILFDFADNEWHITFDGAVRLANAYPHADLICIHWGSVDAPDMTPFNGNPQRLVSEVTRPERIRVLAPGEPFLMRRHREAE